MENSELRNPTEAHGFVWESEPVSKQHGPNASDRKVIGQAQILKVTDVSKFDAIFPGAILGSLDGTSIRVQCQGVARRLISADPKVTVDSLKDGVLNALRGIKVKAVQAPKFVGLNGTVYTSELEAKQANLAHLVDSGIEVSVAKGILGITE